MSKHSSQSHIWTSQGSIVDDPVYTKRVSGRRLLCTKSRICLLILLGVFFIAVLCVIPIYFYISTKEVSPGQYEMLMDHRLDIEKKITSWKMENGSSNTIEHVTQYGFMMQEIVYKLAALNNETLDELMSNTESQNMFIKIVGDFCPEMTSCSSFVTSSPYRTIDGSCNNLQHPEWAMAGKGFRRDLPAAYSDGFGAPRMYGVDGRPLPSARTVSNTVHRGGRDRRTDRRTTVMVMAFGQFMSHDVVSTPTSDGPHSSRLNCSKENVPMSGPFKACYNIEFESVDEFFGASRNMQFTRSAPAMCSNCEICAREQVNEVTSYIDASNVYGSTFGRLQTLRRFRNGLLLVNDTTNLLPWQPVPKCKNGEQKFCFDAGDGRATVVPNLSTLHTIFVRLHNQLATALAIKNPHWGDEKIFQEARKIVVAIMQNIVYSEYLPSILGPETMKKYDLESSEHFRLVHDGDINPDATNAFATAAFRFGHATVPDEQILLDVEYNIEKKTFIEDTYNNPNLTVNSCDGLARWMVHEQGIVSDGLLGEGVRNLLFLDRKKFRSFDLASINIQRGRDHGLPSYNKWRHYCSLPVITEEEFNQSGAVMGDFTAEVADQFREVYRHPDDIDLFSGGVRETVLPSAQVGPTFACILGENFSRFKTGDRFFFENPYKLTGFTFDQLTTIKRLRFSKVICRTMNLNKIPEDVFMPDSEMVNCSDLDDIDMYFWISSNK